MQKRTAQEWQDIEATHFLAHTENTIVAAGQTAAPLVFKLLTGAQEEGAHVGQVHAQGFTISHGTLLIRFPWGCTTLKMLQ